MAFLCLVPLIIIYSSIEPAVSAENLEMICHCKIELASVAEMRLLSITAARHIFNAMKLIDVASEMEDTEEAAYVHYCYSLFSTDLLQ